MLLKPIMIDVWIEELDRSKRILEHRKQVLGALPKGSIQKKVINGSDYYYLFWRENKKVKSKYLGKNLENLAEIDHLIKKRKELEDTIKSSLLDISLLEKAVKLKAGRVKNEVMNDDNRGE